MRIYRLGHGLCVLLYGVKDDGQHYHAVIDCGSRKELRHIKYNAPDGFSNGVINTNEAVQDIVNKIREHGSSHLDLLVSSHQDDDHNNLIYELLNRLNRWGRTPKNDTDTWIGLSCERMLNTYFQTAREIHLSEGTYKYTCTAVKGVEKIEYEQSYDSSATNDMKMAACTKDSVFTGFGMVGFELRIEIACRFEEDKTLRKTLRMDADITVSFYNGRSENMPFSYEDGSFGFTERCRQLSEDVRAACSAREIHEMIALYIEKFLLRRITAFHDQYYMPNRKMNPEYFQKYYFQAQFPIQRIVVGGGDEGSSYGNLSAFLRNYAGLTNGIFSRYEDYTFLTIQEGEVVGTKSQADYSGYGASVQEIKGGTLTVFGTISEAGGAVEKNATSTVINFVYAGPRSVLFPADTTAHHFARIAKEVTADVACIIAPHHGSYNTTFIFDDKKQMLTDDKQPLCTLYSKIAPVVTYVSECYANYSYCLPRSDFLVRAADYAIKDAFSHSISCFTSGFNASHLVLDTTVSVYNTGNLWISEDTCYDYFEIDLMRDPALPDAGRYSQAPDRMLAAKKELPPDRLFI